MYGKVKKKCTDNQPQLWAVFFQHREICFVESIRKSIQFVKPMLRHNQNTSQAKPSATSTVIHTRNVYSIYTAREYSVASIQLKLYENMLSFSRTR